MTERYAEIVFKDQVAGTLRETAGGGSLFAYGSDWKAPIACCFPTQQREYEWDQGLHPFFQNLGAEGWLRQQQARVGHVATEDDFGLLLRYGADCIGAVGIQRIGAGNDEDLEPGNPMVNQGRTISGVQRKLLVIKDEQNANTYQAAGPTGPAPYIAKFNSENIPTLVRNEHLSLRWAAAVLGTAEVNGFSLGQVTNTGETALIVTRFDRTPEGQKLRLEDFAQILCRPRGADYSGKYDGSYEEVAEVIKAHSARPAIDLARLFRRIVVFVLVGNSDGHLKNFSLLETAAGLRLSPLYDVVNSALYERLDQRLALAIGGDKVHLDGVTRSLLTAFGERIGLPPRAITQALTELNRGCRRASGLVVPPAGEGPDGFITRFAEIVSRGCQRIFEE